jgi:hypothetical protein
MNFPSAFKALAGLSLCAALAGPAAADHLKGQVYHVTNEDVYIRMDDGVVARVPMGTASFAFEGAVVPTSSLTVGQYVVADYTPVYGFQRYYHTSTDVTGPRTVYILQDANPDDISILEFDGRVYRLER